MTTAVTTDLDQALAIVSRMSADELNSVTSAVRNRRDILNTLAASDALKNIAVGCRVRIRDNVRPMYLQGLTATVLSVTPYDAKVDFERPALAGKYARGCRVKLHQIEVV